jgi:hypothetical protein
LSPLSKLQEKNKSFKVSANKGGFIEVRTMIRHKNIQFENQLMTVETKKITIKDLKRTL